MTEFIKSEDWEYYAYIKEKTKIDETCTCKYPKEICGICFWKGVTIPPEIGYRNRCSKCIVDTENFKYCNQPRFKPSCCISCIWWEFYDGKRRQIAKIQKRKLVYDFMKDTDNYKTLKNK